MHFFTQDDHQRAVSAMLDCNGEMNPKLMGIMSGIKRRARARSIAAFGLRLSPPPHDFSITSARHILRRLFGSAVSNNDLHRHFAKPGRKANDRVDTAVLDSWFNKHRERFTQEAAALLSQIEEEWSDFTHDAALEAGKIRRDSTQPHKPMPD